MDIVTSCTQLYDDDIGSGRHGDDSAFFEAAAQGYIPESERAGPPVQGSAQLSARLVEDGAEEHWQEEQHEGHHRPERQTKQAGRSRSHFKVTKSSQRDQNKTAQRRRKTGGEYDRRLEKRNREESKAKLQSNFPGDRKAS